MYRKAGNPTLRLVPACECPFNRYQFTHIFRLRSRLAVAIVAFVFLGWKYLVASQKRAEAESTYRSVLVELDDFHQKYRGAETARRETMFVIFTIVLRFFFRTNCSLQQRCSRGMQSGKGKP